MTIVTIFSRVELTMSHHHCPHCGYQIGEIEPFAVGNVAIEPPGRITLNCQEVQLAPTQFIVADALIRASGRVLLRSTLANLIDPDLCEDSVTTYVRRVREAFRQLDPSFNQIECLKGFGAYRWVPARPH